MRPVNLIPGEERGGGRRTRTGPVVYVLVGVLVAALAGVVSVVLTGNQVAERKAEVVRLQQAEEAASERAERLSAFAEFASLQQARTETVSSLARSRFDWERVLSELALVIPGDVWLESLSGTASPGVSVGGGSESSLRGEIGGPALSMSGCAAGHASVAGFVAALEDIDGVTRVGLATSEVSETGSVPSTGSEAGCEVRALGSSFELVVAFDDAPVAGAPSTAAVPPAASDGGVEAAAQQQADAASAIQQSVEEAEQAVTSTQGG